MLWSLLEEGFSTLEWAMKRKSSSFIVYCPVKWNGISDVRSWVHVGWFSKGDWLVSVRVLT